MHVRYRDVQKNTHNKKKTRVKPPTKAFPPIYIFFPPNILRWKKKIRIDIVLCSILSSRNVSDQGKCDACKDTVLCVRTKLCLNFQITTETGNCSSGDYCRELGSYQQLLPPSRQYCEAKEILSFAQFLVSKIIICRSAFLTSKRCMSQVR